MLVGRFLMRASQKLMATTSVKKFLVSSNVWNLRCMKISSSLTVNQCSKTYRDHTIKLEKNSKEQNSDLEVPAHLSGKFDIFSEENAPLILDVEEERKKSSSTNQLSQSFTMDEDAIEEFEQFDLKRGERGVFDIEQLVDLLQSEGAIDIFVVKIPEELRYADQMVIVTGRSARHRKALSQLVRRVFKKKHKPADIIPRIEGDHETGNNVDWIAMDLGNIILHIFARAARERYDLESLWSLGSKHDAITNKPEDPLATLLASNSIYLGDMEPAPTKV